MTIRRLAVLLVAVLSLQAPGLFGAPAQKAAQPPVQAVATFGGGCFWCVEAVFDGVPGVLKTVSGYTGGRTVNPTYDEVSGGGTGHVEVVRVVYDPRRVSYQKLLDLFWRNIDPLTPGAQFCDVGTQYRSAIFYHDAEQKRLADASKAALDKSRRFPTPVVTEIVAAPAFYPAEEYHQNYHEKNPIRYRYYRYNCGRDRRLAEVWKR